MFSVIIPAHNEESYIGATLEGLLAQDATAPAALQVVVAANGCTDGTIAIARGFDGRFAARGWQLTVLDIPEGSKIGALNRADAEVAAGGGDGPLAYLDADVICAPALLGQLAGALAVEAPRYASGTFTIAPPRSWASRHYARLWLKVPYMTVGVPGCGLFAMNAAGRGRWGAFPDLIADDLFVRLHFAPEERVRLPATYSWVLSEGYPALVRVRRRWDAGTRQLLARYPELAENEEKPPVGAGDHLRLFLGQPVSYLVYVSVAVMVKLQGYDHDSWARGR